MERADVSFCVKFCNLNKWSDLSFEGNKGTKVSPKLAFILPQMVDETAFLWRLNLCVKNRQFFSLTVRYSKKKGISVRSAAEAEPIDIHGVSWSFVRQRKWMSFRFVNFRVEKLETVHVQSTFWKITFPHLR